MSWQDDEIAGPMGYRYCVLFENARAAMRAYPLPIRLPHNICPQVAAASSDTDYCPVNSETGLCDLQVHLYGYQGGSAEETAISLDPLMTGWVRRLQTSFAIISFGRKKMLSVGYGGALLADNLTVADNMRISSSWNGAYTADLKTALKGFNELIEKRFEVVDLWDRYLGDSLIRIPAEQLMPWRVMRRARHRGERDVIVETLRAHGMPVGTLYSPLEGRNVWGDTVLNFFCSPKIERVAIYDMCELIKRVVNNG